MAQDPNEPDLYDAVAEFRENHPESIKPQLMFTGRHYKAIAEVARTMTGTITRATYPHEWKILHCYHSRLADRFENDNPKFDREKFL